jgi:DNA-binding MarR family transcriptional regulator
MQRIRVFEKQSGLLRLIVFLDEQDEYLLSKIWADAGISINQGYRSLEKAKQMGLIRQKVDASSYPPKNMISLTPKGKKVAELLRKIEEVLGG